MSFRGDLTTARDQILAGDLSVRDGGTVPRTEDVGYNEAVKLEATYLYADMIDSSGLVALAPRATVAKVLRLYLDLSVRIIRRNGGQIRSFDGDRVMGIFVGSQRHDLAVKSGMQIKWACAEMIQPSITSKYTSIRREGWVLMPGCGAASGEAFIVRGGVRRSSNDLVSVGSPPNLAAKLSDKRKAPYSLRISEDTYRGLTDSGRLSGDVNMWNGPHEIVMGGKTYNYYRSSYKWAV